MGPISCCAISPRTEFFFKLRHNTLFGLCCVCGGTRKNKVNKVGRLHDLTVRNESLEHFYKNVEFGFFFVFKGTFFHDCS